VNKKKMLIAALPLILIIALISNEMILRYQDTQKQKVYQFIRQAEDLAARQGLVQLNTLSQPRYKSIDAEVYYQNSYCLSTIKKIMGRFENVRISHAEILTGNITIPNVNGSGTNGTPPIIFFRDSLGLYDRILTGIAACSEDMLMYTLCSAVENPPELCSRYYYDRMKIETANLENVDDPECFQGCLIEYQFNDTVVNQIWHGPPCRRIEGYIPGRMTITSRVCLDNSCKNNTEDKACCRLDECAYNKECFPLGETRDLENDAGKELCQLFGVNPIWVDPDKDTTTCSQAGFTWFDCNNPQECQFGINSFAKKKDGLCCGDEEIEIKTKCQGEICKNDDLACCREDQCVYNNRCYSAGCADLKTDLGEKKMFCEGEYNRWVDLDKEYCQACLGKDSSAPGLCCGDDEQESKYYTEMAFFNATGNKTSSKFFCTSQKGQCVSPLDYSSLEEGCYDLSREQDNFGKTYCQKGYWYDPDYNKNFCERCGFVWFKDLQNCCGDDREEKLVMEDGKSRCELNLTYIIQKQHPFFQTCGNGAVEGEEECEPPGTGNNPFCTQKTEVCSEGKYGTRDIFGSCGTECSCEYDQFAWSCQNGLCGADCRSDRDCNPEERCDPNSCQCIRRDELNAKNDCPYAVDLKMDKEKYFVNDTFKLIINVFDKDNKLLPNIKFWLDIKVDDEIIGSSIYSTDDEGDYSIRKLVSERTTPGRFEYIVKTLKMGCSTVGDSALVEFVVDSVAPKPSPREEGLTQEIKREVIHTWNITNTIFDIPICGNGQIEIGEVCEGTGVCRNSVGCDYSGQIYDKPEYCSNCQCGFDRWTQVGGEEYCENCDHCGDGIINCGETCDGETTFSGTTCKDFVLFDKIGVCTNCEGFTYTLSSTPTDDCFCDCPENPGANCVNGNYILYPEDYYAGCSNESCIPCDCKDTYTKDTNMDGIEDKCSLELCGNKIDDNDNGYKDESDCIWYYCSQCGQGIFNLCERQECSIFKEGCYFEESLFQYGFCSQCSLLRDCEDYGYVEPNCREDPCNLTSCLWENVTCCTDSDSDKICDFKDNCQDLFNPLQEDTDGDGKGNQCEECDGEPYLFLPQEDNETICNDQIDNDCDYLIDCDDKDCRIPCINITGVINESR
jgi:hypothetical protein